jgi:tRNA (guanosine-2'-O-)-methyltransferase
MLTRQEYLLLDHLARYVTDHKKQFIDKVLDLRTRHVTVVLEDIYQSHNASAVVRTCEGMGIQDIHIIENNSRYEVNRKVLKGSNKWIDLIRYKEDDKKNTERCFRFLKQSGYKILAMDPAADSLPVQAVDIASQKCALVFGNELKGLSTYALEHCDQKVHIPMNGFTESYNISVSVAVSLTMLMSQLHGNNVSINLTSAEKDRIKLLWFQKIVRRSEIIAREFLRTIE